MDNATTLEIAARDGSWVQLVEVIRQTVNHLTVKSCVPPALGTTIWCSSPAWPGRAALVDVVAVNAELVALRPRTPNDKRLLLEAAEPASRRSGNPPRRSISGEIEVAAVSADRGDAPPPKVQVRW